GTGNTWQLVISLSRGWETGGWKPDGVFWVAPRGPAPRDDGLEQALQQATAQPAPNHGGSQGSRTLSFEAPAAKVFDVDVWYPGHPAAHYFGLFQKSTLTPAGRTERCPFLGVVPLHAGSWRGSQRWTETAALY